MLYLLLDNLGCSHFLILENVLELLIILVIVASCLGSSLNFNDCINNNEDSLVYVAT